METESRLEELINGKTHVNFEELPVTSTLKENGYNFIDEKSYIVEKAANISALNTIDFMLAVNYVSRRNLVEEFENLQRINSIIPKNSVKPIALVYDNSIKKDYVRGYITKSDSKITKFKDYLQEGLEDKRHLDIEMVMDLERQMESLSEKLKKEGIYNMIPSAAFDIENIHVGENNDIVLMNMNNYMNFYERDGKANDREIKKAIKYLNKIKDKHWDYLHKSKNNLATHH